MNCEQCGGPIGVRTLPRYEDDGLVGLPGVVVINAARETVCEQCGEAYGVSVPDVKGLIATAAMSRIHIPVRLHAGERRFLRRAIDWPAKALASKMSVTPFTLSRWENDASLILNPAREVLFRLHIGSVLWEKHGWMAGAYGEREIMDLKFPPAIQKAGQAPDSAPVTMEFTRVWVQVKTERHEGWNRAA